MTKPHRTSITLDPVLKANLDALCALTGMSQTDVLCDALREYMKTRHNMQPDKLPKIKTEIRYDD